MKIKWCHAVSSVFKVNERKNKKKYKRANIHEHLVVNKTSHANNQNGITSLNKN